jgi:segregation and condensation protein B
MEERELAAAIEALLFMAGEPVTIKRLEEVFEGEESGRLLEAMADLGRQYQESERGIHIVEVAGGYQMVTRPECANWVKRLEKIKIDSKLSRAALEALAIVAYRQPVTRGEVEAVRGVDSAYVLRTLLERRLVRISGRREGLGRPMLYGTTREFLQYFGLKDLSELPALKEFREVTDSLTEHNPDSDLSSVQEPSASHESMAQSAHMR